MFHEDGTMRKSCKSDLVQQFENEVSPVLSLPDFDPSLTTYIRDGMALVQCMDAKKHRTFGDLATDYCRQLTSCFAKAHTVADVFDRYDVKYSEQIPLSRLKESVVPKWLPIQRCSKSKKAEIFLTGRNFYLSKKTSRHS